MRSDSRAKYRRLMLIYSLVIILPGVFLSILAYRGIYGNIAMADRIIENRLERKSKYFFGGIDESISKFLDAFSGGIIIWGDSSIILAHDSKAYQYIQDKDVLAVAAKQPHNPIKYLDHTTLSFLEGKQGQRGIPGSIYYHLVKNIDDLKINERYQPPFIDFFEDTLSALLVTRLSSEFNVALLLDTRKLLKKNIPVLDEIQGFPNKIAWRILDEYDRILWTDPEFKGKDYMNFNSAKYGTWTLQLEELQKKPMAVIWEAEQQYIVAGFIFVVAALALGLLLTIRSLTRDYHLSQLKSDFVSTVSHEFKSPLTSIRMMSERLANKRVQNDARKQEYYNSMLAQSERLSHLVENILDFSRMDKGRKTYNFEACNLMKLVREVVNYLLIRHEDMGFDIKLSSSEDPIIALIDCQAIHQVLYNLIENAIKFSGDSKRIEVEFSKSRETVRIIVRDFGIGIAKKDQKRVFGQFYRSEWASKQGIKGSGVGLSIVNQIIKAHHGKIELESELGNGSSFIVYLPVNQK